MTHPACPSWGGANSMVWKSDPDSPRSRCAETNPLTVAIRVHSVIFGSKRLTSSSRTNTPPAIGALNAVARPAAAPPATRICRWSVEDRLSLATMMPAFPPICTQGPSRPRASPAPMDSRPPTYLTGRMRDDPGSVRPSIAASTRGMPLPSACGSTRWTRLAAAAVAAPHATISSGNPHQCGWPQAIRSLRSCDAPASNSRKLAAANPVTAPTAAASTASRLRSGTLPGSRI